MNCGERKVHVNDMSLSHSRLIVGVYPDLISGGALGGDRQIL